MKLDYNSVISFQHNLRMYARRDNYSFWVSPLMFVIKKHEMLPSGKHLPDVDIFVTDNLTEAINFFAKYTC